MSRGRLALCVVALLLLFAVIRKPCSAPPPGPLADAGSPATRPAPPLGGEVADLWPPASDAFMDANQTVVQRADVHRRAERDGDVA